MTFESLEDRRLLAVMVTTLVDEVNGVGNGVVSLREAIATATPGATIEFAAHLTQGGPAKILLTHGQLTIYKSLAINGPGAQLLTIDASGNDSSPNLNNGNGSRVFNVNDGTTSTVIDVTIHGLTITGGDVTGGGGGIFSRERLTLRSCFVTDNAATPTGAYPAGGGIYSSPDAGGSLVVDDCTIGQNTGLGPLPSGGGLFIDNAFGTSSLLKRSVVTGNSALREGGGLFAYAHGAGSKITIADSTLALNQSGRGGGASLLARDSGVMLVESSTFVGNKINQLHGNGGGISIFSAFGNVLISNSTVSGNSSTLDGGGIEIDIDGGDPMWIEHSTITRNTSHVNGAVNGGNGGGGIVAYSERQAVHLSNSIVAGNTDLSGRAPDLADPKQGNFPRTFVVQHNLIGTRLGSGLASSPVGSPDANGNIIGGLGTNAIDALLAPLGFNGGLTKSHALLPGSPALNSGNPAAVAGASGVPQFDQRGWPWSRVVGGRVDMGAVEAQANPLPGDYNFNGVVDSADFSVWQDTAGSVIDLRADGSGPVVGVPDGVVNQQDYEFWKENFGNLLSGQGGSSLAANQQLAGEDLKVSAVQFGESSYEFAISIVGDQRALSPRRAVVSSANLRHGDNEKIEVLVAYLAARSGLSRHENLGELCVVDEILANPESSHAIDDVFASLDAGFGRF